MSLQKAIPHVRRLTAAVSWLKEPLESWIARAESQVPSAMPLPTASYTLLIVSEGAGCVDDTWTTTSGPPDPRAGPTAVWTGGEMIVWGGGYNSGNSNTGGGYNSATDSWTPTTTTNAPSARAYHTAVWTGSEMVVWDGCDGTYLGSSGRYNPATDSWSGTNTTNAPTGRASHAAVWSDSEMIVLGGNDGSYQYIQCSFTAKPAHSSLDRKRNDRVGGI